MINKQAVNPKEQEVGKRDGGEKKKKKVKRKWERKYKDGRNKPEQINIQINVMDYMY